jgi:hypothetical protein
LSQLDLAEGIGRTGRDRRAESKRIEPASKARMLIVFRTRDVTS